MKPGDMDTDTVFRCFHILSYTFFLEIFPVDIAIFLVTNVMAKKEIIIVEEIEIEERRNKLCFPIIFP